jgi:protein-tyrosine phosphatase
MMFGRKNRNSIEDFGRLGADIHSHLLPGIDDGSPDMHTSVELVSGLMELGYKKLITTPHVMTVLYPNSRQIILEKQDELNIVLKSQGVDMEIVAAAEYFLDDHFSGMLKNKEPLLTFGSNWVLVEFSLANPSFGTKEMLFELLMQGYVPVIAHPERYLYLAGDRDYYDEMKASGCLFQLNLLSLAGYYGKAESELAHYLIKKNYFDLLGTDLHHHRHLAALHNSVLFNTVRRMLDTGLILNPGL